MTTHALTTNDTPYQPGIGLTLLRYLDLGVLAVALPVFVIADLPLIAYAIVATAWGLQRFVETIAHRRAVATGDRRAAIGVLAGTMIGRIWLTGLAVLGAGLIERDAGVAAGVLAVLLFTIHFMTLFIVKPLEQAASE